MTNHVVRLTLATGVALLGLVLFVSMMGRAAPPESHAVTSDLTSDSGADDTDIRARRVISIPYGITDTLLLSADGRQIAVAGHGECLSPGAFGVEVTVFQEATDAVAYGETRGRCSGEGVRIEWEAPADVLGQPTAEITKAHVYAVATVFNPPHMTIVYEWDKEVTLTGE